MQLLMIGSFVRWLLAVSGTAVATNGAAMQDDLQALLGALATVVSLGWSFYQKYVSKKNA